MRRTLRFFVARDADCLFFADDERARVAFGVDAVPATRVAPPEGRADEVRRVGREDFLDGFAPRFLAISVAVQGFSSNRARARRTCTAPSCSSVGCVGDPGTLLPA